jgi:C-terminal peptidase prc
MKTRISRVFGLVLSTLMLSTTLVFADAPTSGTDNVRPIVLQETVAQAAKQPAAPAKFDGALLYKTVFQNLRDRHITLSDPAARAKWAAEWENKHSAPGDTAFATEESTDKAVMEMIRSLGQRFDYYNPPERNNAEKQQFDATLVGIGASLKVKGQSEAILKARKLGEKADPAVIKKIFDDVRLISDTNPIVVDEPMEGGPAEKAGIKSGDLIIKVDGVSVNGKSLDEVVKTIRGKDATVVKITVTRAGVEQTFDITRAKVVSKVTRFKDLGNGVSYVKLTDWSSQFTEKEMSEALTKAAKGKGLIIDLRGNPGGRLDAVEAVGQMILKEGTFLTMKERRGDAMVETKTVLQPELAVTFIKSTLQPGKIGMGTGEREELIIPETMPIVVLVDEGSASASEILSGLLQANHRAIIVGKTTHGKGVGQQLIQLPFNRNQHLTTFEFLPGGVVMDWIGIIPEIEVTNPDEVIVDPTKDLQLEAAKKALQEQITATEAKTKKSVDTKKANEDTFAKQLEEAKKDAASPPKADDKGATPAPKK